MSKLEDRLREARGLPLFERLERLNRLSVEISVLLKTVTLDPATRAALTKLRAKVRDAKQWWYDTPPPRRDFPKLVPRGRKGKTKTIEQPKD